MCISYPNKEMVKIDGPLIKKCPLGKDNIPLSEFFQKLDWFQEMDEKSTKILLEEW